MVKSESLSEYFWSVLDGKEGVLWGRRRGEGNERTQWGINLFVSITVTDSLSFSWSTKFNFRFDVSYPVIRGWMGFTLGKS